MANGRKRFQGAVPDSVSGIAWIEQLRLGNTDALEQLLATYWQPLFDYAVRILLNADAAQDVVQQAFIRLWRDRRDWRSGSSPRALLFTIVRNLALNERRSQRLRERWLGSGQPARAGPAPPDQVLEYNELSAAVTHAIEQLPLRRREVFTLARFQGLSYQEIADLMGISVQTVANQMSLAMADLRRALGDFWSDSAASPAPGREPRSALPGALSPNDRERAKVRASEHDSWSG
jgi:RNA polymerase sigma-70 factor (ECF subfamily)